MPGTFPKSEDKNSWWDFERVDEEVPQQGFQPDLVGYLRDGTQLFIEVAVTSFIGEEKLRRIRAVGVRTVEIDLSDMMLGNLLVPSLEVQEQILMQTHNKFWAYPEQSTIQIEPASDCGIKPQLQPLPQRTRCPEHRFTIMGMWVSARILPTGSVAVRSWSFNPQLATLFKSWRNDLGGDYNAKYKNWIFFPQYREEVLKRLQLLDSL